MTWNIIEKEGSRTSVRGFATKKDLMAYAGNFGLVVERINRFEFRVVA